MSEGVPSENVPNELRSFEVRDKSFRLGEKVKVRRSSGEIESDWDFFGFDQNGRVRVHKDDGKNILEKSVGIDEFLVLQEGRE